MAAPKLVKTLKVRVRDKHAPLLRAMSREVNFTWNYVNELTSRMIRERHRWPSAFDLAPSVAGASQCFEHIGSTAIDEVCAVHAKSRRQAGTVRLAWRVSNPKARRYSLGWVPFKSRGARWRSGQVHFAGHAFKVWDSYNLAAYEFRASAFVEDARGRWYFTVAVEVGASCPTGKRRPVGIDPGLTNSATVSTGLKAPSRYYRELEDAIGIEQRAKNPERVRALHAKVRNRRNDDAHKLSRAVVDSASAISIGSWKPSASGKSRWAKSARDGALATLKGMLRYKYEHAGIPYTEVDEKMSSRACSGCGAVHDSPRGRAWLGVREWECQHCGVVHDRDINAAINILVSGVGHGPQ